MRKRLAAVGLFPALAITGVMSLTLTSSDLTPMKGMGLHLSCLTGEFNTGRIVWFNPESLEVSSCYNDVCSGSTRGYTFMVVHQGAYVYISSLSREDDSGTWRCVYNNEVATIEIEVYTIPPGLSITQNPNQDVDLSVSKVELKCQTMGCTYPMPTVKWIFEDQSTLAEIEYANTTVAETPFVTLSIAGTHKTCASLEMVYTSTLLIDRRTTFSDNSDKTGTFYCRIEYPDTTRSIVSSSSKNIRFAVRIVNILGSFIVGSTAVMFCFAYSIPQYTFHPWIHKIGQTEIRMLDGVNTDRFSNLTLSNISIEDMGTYICTVNNSITGLDGQLYEIGDIHLYVQEPPVIGETESIFRRETGKSASIEIPFYSSSSNTTVEFIKQFDLFVMSNTSDVSIFISTSNITLTFYTVKVMIPGHVAVLYFRNVTERDFAHYTILLSNEKGNVSMGFDVFAKDSIYRPSVVDSAPIGISIGGAVGIGVGCFLLGCIVSIIAFTFRRQIYDTFFTSPELNNEPVGINVVAAVGIVVCVLIGCILALSP